MSVSCPIHGDRDYSKIVFYKSSSPKMDYVCLTAELQKKINPFESDGVDNLYFKGVILSDTSAPISQGTYDFIINLVAQKKANFTIIIKDNKLLVDISEKS